VKSDKFGRVFVTNQEAFDALYTHRVRTLQNVLLDDPAAIIQFNNSIKKNADSIPKLQTPYDLSGIELAQFDRENQSNWYMPDEYKDFPLEERLYEQCSSEEEVLRVSQELELFAKHGMIPAIKYLKYLVDTMREHRILWGVGRGSSVASYCLFLLGVHRINSMQHGLDIHEFLK
jgi:DNA polymerase III alpha subunit